jgi:3-methyladenine DNA glycosylase/8-oxoguanine DNA glycosylase
VDRLLRSLPGIGVWTSAETRSRAHGDADAVSFGDYHIAKNVGYALTGEAVDDDGLAELLEPYRPHRYRVQRLVELARAGRPRRGARMAPRTHLPR